MRHQSRLFHTLSLLGCLLLLMACHSSPEGEQSAFGPYVDVLDDSKLQQSLRQLLDSDTSRWMAISTLKEYYADVERATEHPIWYTRMGVSEDADQLLAHLRQALPANGMDSTAFFVPQIAADLQMVHQLSFDSLGIDINNVLPRLDYHLSKAFMLYSTHQRYGFVRPGKLLNNTFMRDDSTGYAQLFDYEVEVPNYKVSLEALQSDDRMFYLQSSEPSNPLYATLQRALATTTDAKARRRLLVNMERCRWQTKQPTELPRVEVNLPAQQLWAIGRDSVLNMRIVCGATATKTPMVHSEIRYMQVNPDWLIPMSIIKKDITRHEHDSAYFARNHYYIVNRQSGDTLNPMKVSADQMRSGLLRIGQTGGAHNSLGRIIFRFPNKFDIYLHDTNNRGAFSRERRTLSHGCMRVQKPFQLAQFLLPKASEWDLDRLRISIDLPPESQRGHDWLEEHDDEPKPHHLLSYMKVSPAVPVYVLYYTVYPNPETGDLETFPDIYKYDELISKYLQHWHE